MNEADTLLRQALKLGQQSHDKVAAKLNLAVVVALDVSGERSSY